MSAIDRSRKNVLSVSAYSMQDYIFSEHGGERHNLVFTAVQATQESLHIKLKQL